VVAIHVKGLGNFRFCAVLINIFRTTLDRKALIEINNEIFSKNYIFSVVKEQIFRIYDFAGKFLSNSGKKIHDCEYAF